MSALAYITADVSGWESVAFWLGVGLLGVALGWAIALAIGWAVDNWPGDLGSRPMTRPRYETLITVLGLIGAALIYITKEFA